MIFLAGDGVPQLAGRTERALDAGGATLGRVGAFFLQLLEKLENGDPLTWAAFIAVSLVALTALGLWRGTIRIGRR